MTFTAAAAGVGFCILCDRQRRGLEDGLCRKCRPLTRTTVVPPLPPTPTHHLPGTPEKVSVMKWRDDQGYQVHHPLDHAEDVRANGPSRYQGPGFGDGRPRVL